MFTTLLHKAEPHRGVCDRVRERSNNKKHLCDARTSFAQWRLGEKKIAVPVRLDVGGSARGGWCGYVGQKIAARWWGGGRSSWSGAAICA